MLPISAHKRRKVAHIEIHGPVFRQHSIRNPLLNLRCKRLRLLSIGRVLVGIMQLSRIILHAVPRRASIFRQRFQRAFIHWTNHLLQFVDLFLFLCAAIFVPSSLDTNSICLLRAFSILLQQLMQMRTIDPVVFIVAAKECAAIRKQRIYDFHVRNIFRIAVDEGHLMSQHPINFVGSAVRQTACCGKRSARVIDGVRLLHTRAAHIVRQNLPFLQRILSLAAPWPDLYEMIVFLHSHIPLSSAIFDELRAPSYASSNISELFFLIKLYFPRNFYNLH